MKAPIPLNSQSFSLLVPTKLANFDTERFYRLKTGDWRPEIGD